jgi:hypothetical protein
MEIKSLFGLPAHPLVIHAVVVLIPLVALGAIAAVLFPAIRARIGVLVAIGAVIDLVMTPLATGSGEALEDQVGTSALLEDHAELGELLLPWVAVLAVALVLFLVIHRRQAGSAEAVSAGSGEAGSGAAGSGGAQGWPARRVLGVVLASVVIVSAAGSTVVVALIGHSGAKAVWSDTPSAATSGGGED